MKWTNHEISFVLDINHETIQISAGETPRSGHATVGGFSLDAPLAKRVDQARPNVPSMVSPYVNMSSLWPFFRKKDKKVGFTNQQRHYMEIYEI